MQKSEKLPTTFMSAVLLMCAHLQTIVPQFVWLPLRTENIKTMHRVYNHVRTVGM